MHIESFYTAMHSPRLDSSDFILLAIYLLSNQKVDKSTLNEVRLAYLNIDYEKAIQLIEDITVDLKTCPIPAKGKACKQNDDPFKNRSRRYFETLMSLDLWNSQGARDFACYAKLGQLMASLNADYSKGTNATNLADAENIISDVRRVAEETPFLYNFAASLRTLPTSVSFLKDRGNKHPYDIYSCHIGILRSQDPADISMRKELKDPKQSKALIPYEVFSNKITDIFGIDYAVQGFSANHPTVPYVNSISGTTFNLVSVLNSYIERYKGDDHLEEDINRLVRGFIAFTCMRGYHSFREMVEVLRDQHVQKLFATHQIKIHEGFVFPQQNLEKNIQAASLYAKQLNLRECINEHIKLKQHGFFKAIDNVSHFADRLNVKPFYKTEPQSTMDLRRALSELIMTVPSETDRLKMKNKAVIDDITLEGPGKIVIQVAGRYKLQLSQNQCKLSDKNFDRSIFPVNPAIIEQIADQVEKLNSEEQSAKKALVVIKTKP